MRLALEAALLCTGTAAVCLLLRAVRPEYAFAAGLAGGIGALLLLAAPLTDTLGEMSRLAERTGIASAPLLVQACLAALAGDLLASLCKDAGENALAARVELCARVAAAAMALPLVGELIDAVGSLAL